MNKLIILDNESKCGRLPLLHEQRFENVYWQVLETSNGTFKMFNAYYDKRSFYKDDPLIRILAFINRVDPVVKTFCQLWFAGINEPIVEAVFEYQLIWNRGWSVNSIGSQPHLIGCRNPIPSRVPLSVSLVEKKCDNATNHLRVINNYPKNKKKKPFAVCAKDLDFMDDQTTMITEWIEILSLVGADKIFIYVIKIHPNMMKALKFYEMLGKVKVEMITEPKGLPNRAKSLTQWLQNELISLNDCLYKHMNEYEFLVPLDIDEIILPTKNEDKTWMDLMKRAVVKTKTRQDESFSAYVVHNVFFLFDNNHEGEFQPNIPKNMTFLQHIYRAANFSRPGVGAKSFQNTEKVIKMHNHFPLESVGRTNVDFYYIEKEDGQLQHYRRDCENYPKEECAGFKSQTVKDLTLWKYKDKLIENFNRSIKALKKFEEN